jgi:hypothetical protein
VTWEALLSNLVFELTIVFAWSRICASYWAMQFIVGFTLSTTSHKMNRNSVVMGAVEAKIFAY